MTTNDKDCRPEFEAWLASCGKNPLMWNTSDAMLAAWAAATRAQREALARAEAERDRWIGHYNHLMEQHMPRTGDGCEKGWSRVVEARELQAKLADAVEKLAKAEETIARLQLGAVT